MTNKEWIDIIIKKMSRIDNVKFISSTYEGLPFNNFIAEFMFNQVKVSFTKDRFFIEVELEKDQEFFQLYKIDKTVRNLQLSIENIELLVSSLEKTLPSML